MGHVDTCQTQGAQKMIAKLPDALDCGHISNHTQESDWAYIECVFGAFDIHSIEDAVQKAEAIGLHLGLPDNPVEGDLVSAAGEY